MNVGKTLLVTDRKAWRSWLAKNYNKEPEIWLIFYRKDSGKARIAYNDAVEEALCYGWIDSIVKGVDSESFAQRFSPRKPTSVLSQMNRERIHKLIKQKKMTKVGLAALAHVFDPEKDKPETFVIPQDILAALKKDKTTWENFQKFPESYKKIRISFIEHMRSRGEETFQKTLQHFLKMTAKNKRFGFVKEMS
jgi:uncharacterized protein YdeI (YjbR/CyaY-like superfamily)